MKSLTSATDKPQEASVGLFLADYKPAAPSGVQFDSRDLLGLIMTLEERRKDFPPKKDDK